MRILTISTLYPNNQEPKHGIFVHTRLKHLVAKYDDLDIRVIAPVPWFPIKSDKGPLAEYAKYVGVAEHEKRDQFEVYHPRYLVIPKIGMYLTPFFLFLSMYFCVRKLQKQGYEFDVIDGHYFYPDGVAISWVAKLLNKPFTITARGTDINLIPQYPIARSMIKNVARRASGIITVCKALKDELLAFADVGDKAQVLRNGVDLKLFHYPGEEQHKQLKTEHYGIQPQRKLLVSVGHLIERKGHHLVIESLKHLPECDLIIAGDGVERAALERLVQKLDLKDRVTFAGALPQNELAQLYQAADTLVLASSREGWANVLLEAMACGAPVVATNLWGTPEVVAADEAGVLVDRSAESIADGVKRLFANPPDRQATRAYAEQFDWDDTSAGQYALFHSIAGKKSPEVVG